MIAIALLLAAGCTKTTAPNTEVRPTSVSTTIAGTLPPGVAAPAPTSAATTSPTPLGPPPTSGAPLEPEAVKPIDPGNYPYDESGITKIRGCSNEDRPAPTPTSANAEAPNGSRQQVVRDRRDPRGRGSTTLAVLEYRKDGIYLVYLRSTEQDLVSSVTEFEPSPPVLILPAKRSTGSTWSYALTSKDGKVKVSSSNRVANAGEQATTGSGRALRADRIDGTSRITGQSPQGTLDLTSTTTTWFSDDIRLPVKEVTDVRGTVGLCQVESRAEALLRS